ncbi:MAG: OsmC family protein [Bacteroidota bacterium]
MKTHQYNMQMRWTGNKGTGTSSYRAYSRDHEYYFPGKAGPIPGSSDPSFRGDPSRYNPEELLLASLSSCHMLWFLHFCSVESVIVLAYEDTPIGEMAEDHKGSGRFTSVTLHPHVQVAEANMQGKLEELHHRAHQYCFIANSVNFPVLCEGGSST